MPSKFFRYLDGMEGLPSTPKQEAEGLFECSNGCFSSTTTAVVQGNFVYFTCPNGHENKEPYNGLQ